MKVLQQIPELIWPNKKIFGPFLLKKKLSKLRYKLSKSKYYFGPTSKHIVKTAEETKTLGINDQLKIKIKKEQ